MNRYSFLVILLCTVLSLTSCTEDNSFFNEPAAVRTYEKDADILMQFVDVDAVTGKFKINPDKKIYATDYVINHSREELMKVSSFNRNRFIREMEDVNGLLYSMRQSGIASAMIYSTVSSNSVIEGNNTDYMSVEKLGYVTRNGNDIVHFIVSSGGNESRSFLSRDEMIMNVSANSRGVFYFYQLSFRDSSGAEKGIVILSGVRNAIERNSFLINSKSHDEMIMVKGLNLFGDGTLSVSITE